MNEINTTKGRLRQFVSQALFDVRKPKTDADHCTIDQMNAISKGVDSISNSLMAELKVRAAMALASEKVVAIGKMTVGDDTMPILDGRGEK